MKRFPILLILLFFAIAAPSFAQTATVTGKVVDSKTGETLVGASVVLLDNQNKEKFGGITNPSGIFELKNIAKGAYKVRVTYVSYTPFEKNINIQNDKTDLGTLRINPAEVKTGEVEVTAQAPIAQQKNDTTEYNSSAYKTNPDATTEDLAKKMPGVQIDPSGTVTAHGEQVKKVLVDGKPYFGDDPTLALRNLPADVVDKIQVYDRMSDQAEFSGFDDGQTEKAMNIITKRDKRKGVFGQIYGAGGTDKRYSLNLNTNIFNGPQKIAILGKSNNINEQNFSFQDILGIMGGSGVPQMLMRGGGPPGGFRPGGGGARQGGGSFAGGNFMARSSGFNPADFFVSAPAGITTTHALGLNYMDSWGDNIDITGSYFFNYSNNSNNQYTNRSYFYPQAQYNELSEINSSNLNHRANLRLTYNIDSSNSILFTPRFSAQINNKNNTTNSNNNIVSTSVNSTDNTLNTSNLTGLNFSGNLLYRHRFAKPGRTFSINLGTDIKDKYGSSNLFSTDIYTDTTGSLTQILNQYSTIPTNGYNYSITGYYTEPIDSSNLVNINYSASYQRNNTDRRTFNYDSLRLAYDLLDTSLSSTFNNNYYTQSGGVGYRLRGSNYSFTASVNYQWSKLLNDQSLPYIASLNYTFNNVLPSMLFNYKLSDKSNIRVYYRTNTNLPDVEQLQSAINNSNPQIVTTGNPSLKEEYSHTLIGRYSTLSQDRSNIFLAVLALNYKANAIANSYIIDTTDRVIQGYLLKAGSQFIQPVNMNGYWSGRTFLTYGLPVKLIMTNVNFNLTGSYTRSPNILNNIENISNIYTVGGQIMLASNISENLDFTVSARTDWNKTNNSFNTQLNNNYTTYSGMASLNWIFWEGFLIQGNLSYNYYSNVSLGNPQSYTLLNLGFGKKFLEKNRAEVKLYAFDVLNQNKSLTQTVAENSIEQTTNQALGRYLMLQFTYSLR